MKLQKNEGFFDIEMENGSFKTIEKTDSIAQSIRILLNTFRGDDRLHPNLGLQFNLIFGQRNLTLVRSGVIEAIFQDPRVKEIVDLRIEKDAENVLAFGSISTKKEDKVFFKEILQME